MIVLGIDPGSRRIGYGVVRAERNSLSLIETNLLAIASTEDFGALREAQTEFEKLVDKFSPDLVAIEKIFLVRNQKTGIRVAEFRGALLASALQKEIPVKEFSPREIKAGLTGNGAADKRAVLKMVRLILRLPHLSIIDDASDAVAIALYALQASKLDRIVST